MQPFKIILRDSVRKLHSRLYENTVFSCIKYWNAPIYFPHIFLEIGYRWNILRMGYAAAKINKMGFKQKKKDNAGFDKST